MLTLSPLILHIMASMSRPAAAHARSDVSRPILEPRATAKPSTMYVGADTEVRHQPGAAAPAGGDGRHGRCHVAPSLCGGRQSQCARRQGQLPAAQGELLSTSQRPVVTFGKARPATGLHQLSCFRWTRQARKSELREASRFYAPPTEAAVQCLSATGCGGAVPQADHGAAGVRGEHPGSQQGRADGAAPGGDARKHQGAQSPGRGGAVGGFLTPLTPRCLAVFSMPRLDLAHPAHPAAQ